MCIPLVPIILVVLLESVMETDLLIAMKVSKGDRTVLFQAPTCITHLVLAFMGFAAGIHWANAVTPGAAQKLTCTSRPPS